MPAGLTLTDKRLKVLKKHLDQSVFFYKHLSVYNEYQKIKNPKMQNKFYENNRTALLLFKSAKRHFDKCMKAGYKGLPVQKWKAEQAGLIAERKGMYREYNRLKEEVRRIEMVQRDVRLLMNSADRQKTIKRSRELSR